MFTLAIVGRPNVGKSTLFNKLAGKHLAIVDDTPGVTRDWREAEGRLFDHKLRIIDTAGLEDTFDDSIFGRMRKQTEAGLALADAILFVVDGKSGLTPLDEHFATWLRKQDKPVILAVNKCENPQSVQGALAESYSLGLGDPISLSAEHNRGMDELYEALTPYLEDSEDSENSETDNDDVPEDIDDIEGDENFEIIDEEDETKPIKIAIVGRPNVGKSTLLNALLGTNRSMTGPEAGITRDAVTADFEYEGRAFKLVDTAGMRRRTKVTDKIERLSVQDTLRAIRLAQIVVLMIDGTMLIDKQDQQIADHVINEGRALIVAVNKWDLVEDRADTLDELKHQFGHKIAQIKRIPYVTLSALTGKNIKSIMITALKTYDIWGSRVGTAKLNKWLGMMESRNPAPLISGRQNRLKYIAQIKTRPPTFALWVSRPDKLGAAYRRYIMNGLREDFNIPGVPIRLLVRKSKNPYAK
jgi:GTP-binding protein